MDLVCGYWYRLITLNLDDCFSEGVVGSVILARGQPQGMYE